MSLPAHKKLSSDKQEFYWEAEGIYIFVSRIREHSDGRITAELLIKGNLNGVVKHIHQAQLNLISSRTKKELIKSLEAQWGSADWLKIIEQMSVIAIAEYRKGTPAILVERNTQNNEIEYLLEPFLVKGKPTVLYGEGGTFKSYLALTLALICKYEIKGNPLGMNPQKAVPLYLDYESDDSDIAHRLENIGNGWNTEERLSVLYRQCSLPLIDDVGNIQEIIVENNVDFVFLDSIGASTAKGNLLEAATAINFFSALRQLNVTSLLITHTAKNLGDKKTTPFGSVYFTNMARSIFELKKQQDAGDNAFDLLLLHKKNNLGKLLLPKSLKISFDKGVKISKQDIMDVSGYEDFEKHIDVYQRIKNFLLINGSKTIKEIAEEFDLSPGNVRAVLSKHKDKHFVKIGDKWGMRFDDEVY